MSVKGYIRRLRHDQLTRDIGQLVSGNLLGNIIVIVATPFLMQLYSPEQYGEFAMYLAVASIVGVVSCLRLELAIPIADDEDLGPILHLALAVLSCVSLMALIMVLILGKAIEFTTDTAMWVKFVALGIFFCGLLSLLVAQSTREHAITQLQRAKIIQSVMTVGAQISLALTGFGVIGLIGGEIIGRACSCLYLSPSVFKLVRGEHQRNANGITNTFRRMCLVAKKYNRFPMILAPAALFNVGSHHTPAIALNLLYGSAAAGWYGQAWRLVNAPMALISDAVGRVFFSNFSAERRNNGSNMQAIFRAGVVRLTIFSVLPILIAILSPIFIPMFLGAQWDNTGKIVFLMLPLTLGIFIVNPLSTTLVVLGELKSQFCWDLVRLLTVTMVFVLVGCITTPFLGAVLIYSIVGAALYLGIGLYCWNKVTEGT